MRRRWVLLLLAAGQASLAWQLLPGADWVLTIWIEHGNDLHDKFVEQLLGMRIRGYEEAKQS